MRVLVLATFLSPLAVLAVETPRMMLALSSMPGCRIQRQMLSTQVLLAPLGSLCSQTSDCLDHRQRCYVGNANGSLPRCTVDCNDLDDCVEFSTGARISLDDTDCARPANSSGSRRFCPEPRAAAAPISMRGAPIQRLDLTLGWMLVWRI